MITLYDYELSGNCYKVRQLAAWLGLPLKRCFLFSQQGKTLPQAG